MKVSVALVAKLKYFYLWQQEKSKSSSPRHPEVTVIPQVALQTSSTHSKVFKPHVKSCILK